MKAMRVKANQLEFQVQDYQPAGDAIIFLHFSGANLMMWQRIVPFFQDNYRLVLVDLRGHGKSDKPESGYHMDEMARDVVGIMQSLQLEEAHLVGSSLGAEVALSIAANYPEMVTSLVCDGALSSEYGPYGLWEGTRAEFDAHVASQLERLVSKPDTVYPSVDAMVETSRKSLDEIGWWNEYVEAVERYDAHQLADGKYMRSLSRRAMHDYMKHYYQYRLEDYYPRVMCPILMLPGVDVFENERERDAMQGLCKLAPRAEIVTVRGWEHPYGWMLDPGGVCEAILKFFKELPA